MRLPTHFKVFSKLSDIPVMLEYLGLLNKEPDFGINGQSAKLGYFQVERVKFNLKQNIGIKVVRKHVFNTQRKYEGQVDTSVYDFKFDNAKKVEFDIYDFQVDRKGESFSLGTSLGELVADLELCFFELLKDPVMSDITVEDWFSNWNELEVKLFVNNGLMKGKDIRIFKLRGKVNLDCQQSGGVYKRRVNFADDARKEDSLFVEFVEVDDADYDEKS